MLCRLRKGVYAVCVVRNPAGQRKIRVGEIARFVLVAAALAGLMPVFGESAETSTVTNEAATGPPAVRTTSSDRLVAVTPAPFVTLTVPHELDRPELSTWATKANSTTTTRPLVDPSAHFADPFERLRGERRLRSGLDRDAATVYALAEAEIGEAVARLSGRIGDECGHSDERHMEGPFVYAVSEISVRDEPPCRAYRFGDTVWPIVPRPHATVPPPWAKNYAGWTTRFSWLRNEASMVPPEIGVPLRRLVDLDERDRKTHLPAIIFEADRVLDALEETDALESRRLRAAVLAIKLRAIAYRDLPDVAAAAVGYDAAANAAVFERTYADLEKIADLRTEDFALIAVRRHRRRGHPLDALRLLQGLQPKATAHARYRVGEANYLFDKKRRDLYDELGWTSLRDAIATIMWVAYGPQSEVDRWLAAIRAGTLEVE